MQMPPIKIYPMSYQIISYPRRSRAVDLDIITDLDQRISDFLDNGDKIKKDEAAKLIVVDPVAIQKSSGCDAGLGSAALACLAAIAIRKRRMQ